MSVAVGSEDDAVDSGVVVDDDDDGDDQAEVPSHVPSHDCHGDDVEDCFYECGKEQQSVDDDDGDAGKMVLRNRRLLDKLQDCGRGSFQVLNKGRMFKCHRKEVKEKNAGEE